MNRRQWLLIGLSLGTVAFLSSLTLVALFAGGLPDPLVSIIPAPNTENVDLGSDIEVLFGKRMDHASVEAAFTISPTVAGRFIWEDGDPTFDRYRERVFFQPADLFRPNTRYQVTLKAGIRTVDGQVVLTTDYAWSFTTRQAWNALTWGSGAPAQLLDPAGKRAIRYQASYRRFTALFQLHSVTEGQFANIYPRLAASTPRYVDPAGLPLATQWQEAVDRLDPWRPVETHLPPVSPGFYLLTVSHPYAGQDQILVILSPYALVVKRGTGGQVTAWAIYQPTQTPAAGMSMAIYDGAGTLVAQGLTGPGGVFSATLIGDTSQLVVLGQLSGHVAAAATDPNWQSTDYHYWPAPDSVPPDRVHIYTDRPIYRPGHTVQFKAILRHDVDGSYTPVAAGRPISVTLRDPRRNVVATQVLTTTTFGTLDGAFALADEVSLGDYTLELSLAGRIHTQTFQVEAYRKPEYEVKVVTAAAYYFVGDTFTATIQADYYFGQPVSNTPARLKVYRRPLIYWWWYGDGRGELILDLQGNTGPTGRWTPTLDLSKVANEDAILTLEATVTDASNQPVTTQREVPLYWSEYVLAVRQDRYGYSPGEPIVVDVTAANRDNAPSTGLELEATLWIDYPERRIIQQQQLATDARGQARATFNNVAEGWYRITIGGTDHRGRRFEATSWAWVFDWTSGWYWQPPAELTVTADREQYAPGDTARLLIQSPVTGTALLALERGQVHAEFPVELHSAATTVDVAILPEFAPNVFARVHIFKPGPHPYAYDYTSQPEAHLLSGGVELKVPVTERALHVSVTPDRTTYRPRDIVTFTIQVTQSGVQSLAPNSVEAEVSLALVDEAIYALAEDRSGDLFAAFYSPRPDNTATYDSHRPLRYLWVPYDWVGPPSRSPTATPAPEGTRTPATAPKTTSNQPRSVFLDTAYWNARIRTDANGRAVVAVPLPDNLTRWRVVARAITVDTRVGQSTTSITVTQDVVIRPALPRFLVQGDTLAVDSVVHNFTRQDLTATTTLSATGLVILGDAGPRDLRLAPGSAAVADWTAVASQVGTAEILCRAETPAGSDAVLLPLPVKPFAVPERESRAGVVEQAITETVNLPFNAVPGISTLEIGLAPSVAASLMDGLDELLGYPYGCVEQTMSKVLPNAMVAQAFRKLGLHNERLEKELPDMVRVGLQKLYGFQHSNGGWGWWYDDDDNVYQTAYVLFGLTMTQRAGFDVDPGVLDRGFAFLASRLDATLDPRIRAYTLYVMSTAGRGDLARSQLLLSEREKLDTFARAALALTLAKEGDPAAAQSLADDLIASAVDAGATAYWPDSQSGAPTYRWQTMSSAAKNTAMALEALAQLRPDAGRAEAAGQNVALLDASLDPAASPLLPKAARWLMNHRQGKSWRSTQETAFAILALSDYIVVAGEMTADYTYRVYLNDHLLATGVVTPALVTRPIAPIVVDTGRLSTGENRVQIEKQGTGRLYYTLSLRLRLFYDRFQPVKSAGSGLALERTYQDATTHQPRARFSTGELVEVRLALNATDQMMYVLLEDPLPAGLEGVQERMNLSGYGDIWFLSPRGGFWWPIYGYNRKEIHDDRVSFFISSLWPGQHEFTYLARATHAGLFSALPAEASPMYEPEIWSRSSSALIEISPETVASRPALRGDIDRDCQVTSFDARQVAGLWQARWDETTFNPGRDLDGDGVITVADIMLVTSNDSRTCRTGDAPLPPDHVVMRPSLNLAPTQTELGVGKVFTTVITIDKAVDLGAFELALTFNPSVLQVVHVEPGPFLSSSGDNPITVGPRIDQGAGRVTLGAYSLPGRRGADGTGVLASVVFAGRGLGTSPLALADVQVLDSGGSRQPVQELRGSAIAVRGFGFYLPLVRR